MLLSLAVVVAVVKWAEAEEQADTVVQFLVKAQAEELVQNQQLQFQAEILTQLP